jgi:hypothetical protein
MFADYGGFCHDGGFCGFRFSEEFVDEIALRTESFGERIDLGS